MKINQLFYFQITETIVQDNILVDALECIRVVIRLESVGLTNTSQ